MKSTNTLAAAALSLLLIPSVRTVRASDKYTAPPNCSDPKDPEPVEPVKSENPACEDPHDEGHWQGWGTSDFEKCNQDRKDDEEKRADYNREWKVWRVRQDLRDRCEAKQKEQDEAARFAALPGCSSSKDYTGKSYDIVWGWDMAVVVSVTDGGADPMHPKAICRLSEKQETRIRASWQSECRRKPAHVFHNESVGLGCWKIVDECGDRHGTVCSKY